MALRSFDGIKVADPDRSSTPAEEHLMKTPALIAGSMLILAMAHTAQAQQGTQQARVAQEPQLAPPPPQLPPPQSPPPQLQSIQLQSIQLPPRRAAGEDVRPVPDKTRLVRRERLSPEDRQRLRQDINEAGRDLYRRQHPRPF